MLIIIEAYAYRATNFVAGVRHLKCCGDKNGNWLTVGYIKVSTPQPCAYSVLGTASLYSHEKRRNTNAGTLRLLHRFVTTLK